MHNRIGGHVWSRALLPGTAERRRSNPIPAALLVLCACGTDAAGPRPSLRLLPDSAGLLEGDTARFAPVFAAGNIVPAAIAWTSSDTSVVTIGPTGLVTAHRPGSATVIASAAGAADTAILTIAPAYFVGAGDIAVCGSDGDERTAAILDTLPGTVFTTGDNAYLSGTVQQFTDCYGPSWGRHTSRTRPAPGNHDYLTAGAAGYFGYFGAAAGPAGLGYYSYDIGAWHLVSLNSEIAVGPGSVQLTWLQADLAAHPQRCILAYWHRPRFSSGANHGNSPAMQPLWDALQAAGADVVLAGHDHIYERFAPQEPTGAADPSGIREFVVGTGGGTLYAFSTPQPNSEVRYSATFGVLQLRLRPTAYDWKFVAVDGTVPDAGSAICH